MVVSGGTTARPGGARVAGGLLAAAAVLTVVGTAVPIYSFGGGSEDLVTVTGWGLTVTHGVESVTYPSPGGGFWLVVVALIAVVAAGTVLAGARGSSSRSRLFGVLGAGILIAGALGQTLPTLDGVVSAGFFSDYRMDVGWILLVVAAVSGLAAAIVVIATAPRAAAPAVPAAPGPTQPSGAPQPPPTRPFPAQPPDA
ncbi:hypothetical protein ACQEVB_28140 [Pseudonocardia sp. CA-107938]|uniref:hypothetical protein n=1 Tax=Pseudonocardia sp. CA-107938 TaxID=3240021 RepID=UPI003D91B865